MTILKGLVIFFVVITVLIGFYFFISLSEMCESIAKLNNIKATNVEVTQNQNASILERLDFENQFLTLIDDLLSTEIACMLKSYVILNNQYPIIKLDEDVKSLSNTVYQSIKKETFVDNAHFLTDEYLMSYITKKATVLLLVNIKDLTLIGVGPQSEE